jgi:ClpP class serine protease
MESWSALLAHLPVAGWSWLWGVAATVLLYGLFKVLGRKGGSDRFVLRAGLLARLEQARGSRVLAIVNRDERRTMPMRFGREHIELDTAEQLLSVIRRVKPDQPLDIILHTPGGEVTAALQIANALKAHRGRKTAFIPYYAFSAGTLIALTTDEIVMGPQAVLGPIDPQIRGIPAASLLRLRAEKSVDRIGDFFLVMADHAEKSLEEARAHACDLVNDAHKPTGTCALTDDLVSGVRTHGYPITVTEAKARGINVSTRMPDMVYALVDSYRDPADAPALYHRDAP